MKNIKEQMVFMEYPEPFIRLQKSEKSVNMPYLHFHEGHEIYIMIEGAVNYILPDDTYELNSGTFILINPFTIHKKVTKTDVYTTFLINFNSNILKKYFTDEALKKILNPFSTLPYGKLSEQAIQKILKLASRLEKTKDKVMIAMSIAEILHLLDKSEPLRSTHPDAEETLDKSVYEYVANNLDKRITLDTLASELYISKQALTSQFQKNYGTSPIYFVNRVKMNFAHSMLLYPEFSIERISKYCGFNSLSYFSKVFKDVFGQTPSEYRRSALNNE
ncbi:MAG: helix-turn-helix domain-containing protein [Ruminococcaceae bacterium]|nr:helix-turn-helix domain-containing protein [Oscillospiraceae bacterium]